MWIGGKRTTVGKHIVGEHANGQVDEVKEEVAMVVDTHAVVDPRAVAVARISQNFEFT